MAVGDLFHLQMQYAIDQREMANTFGYEQTSGNDDAEVAQLLVDAYDAATRTAWTDVAATDVTFQCVIARRVSPSAGIPGFLFYDGSVVGTDAGLACPANSCPTMKFVQSEQSARHNGRKFLSVISEDRLTNGSVNAAFLAAEVEAWATAHEAVLTAAGGGGQQYTPVILRRASAGPPPVTWAGWSLDEIVVQGIMNTQRGRRTRRTGFVPNPGP